MDYVYLFSYLIFYQLIMCIRFLSDPLIYGFCVFCSYMISPMNYM